ncbi:MAG: molybdopterin molybdotransferase MoeA [Candidatus Thermoplasmatota archaeon]|nr:molybdopterin molybdotransferase MoeA [Candidatus Thermoplasmatota archaeon]
MRPFKSLISDEEALNIIMENIRAIDESEALSIDLADRRILAEDVKAPYDVPPFNRSAMDGYAVRSEDALEAGVPFRVVGEIFAGTSKEIKVNESECVKIATGAPLPDSCDAVVMVENTEAVEGEKDKIRISRPVQPFENVSRVGEDIKKGETVLERGTLLDPSKIGALAALGIQRINVLRKPGIAIISTGNELLPLGKDLEGSKIYNINTYTLSALLERNFCKSVAYDIVEDREEELKRALNSAMDNDMIVFSGGSSVGERDMLVDILGKAVLFHGVRIKPGKPTMFALYKDKPVLCLPGFPTSCLMNGYLFLVPAIRKMAGAPERERRIVRARMAQSIKLSRGRKKNVTVRLEGEHAYSVYKESSTITSLAGATGFITVDADRDQVEKDEEVEVELFSW